MLVFLIISLLTPSTFAYSIGGGLQPSYSNGGGTYDIGGGVSPNNNNNNGNGEAGSYCTYDTQCSASLKCTPSVNGVRICLPTSSSGSCTSSQNCQSGTTCVIRNGVGSCQVDVGGYVRSTQDQTDIVAENGQLNSACERDADCDPDLMCVLYFGELMCRHPIKPLLPLRCDSVSDCPSPGYLCVFSTALQDRVCYKYGDTVTDGYVIPIKHRIAIEKSKHQEESDFLTESHAIFPSNAKRSPESPVYMKMEDTVAEMLEKLDEKVDKKENNRIVVKEQQTMMVDDEPIDPASTICEFDYHCRMGESCSGRVRFVDRNITVCRYDMLNKNRQCIYHSDCLSGQRCTVTPANSNATCQPDIRATLGTFDCMYDYECSGGEKCTKVDGEKFRCSPSPTVDPRRNQLCTTNAQCPFQQVCRRSAGFSLCVDISLAQNPALLEQRIIELMRSFILRS